MSDEVYETMLSPSLVRALSEESWRSAETYVSSGAYMQCSFGTHEEVLNQPVPNSVLINENPMMTINDCKVAPPGEGNLYSFGYCRSKMLKAYQMDKDNQGLSMYGGIQDYDPGSGRPYPSSIGPESFIFGPMVYPCKPEFVPSMMSPLSDDASAGPQWENGSKIVNIDGVPVLTSKSCLRCVNSGLITFLTNGMDMPPLDFVKHYVK